ncbi:unnamed protein product [Enterobius vermicularis]|uniref:Btz domain-containing protein n=1 Tax=Enterobius vermicularis TaxID=51028 RepID=A0A0N4UUH8_ENTVE|nr:unnamed protein product [Enterobius vermicularis]
MSSKHGISSSKKHQGSPDFHRKGKHDTGKRTNRSRSPHGHHRSSNRRPPPARRLSPKSSVLSNTKAAPVNELDLLSGDTKIKTGLSLGNPSPATTYPQRIRDVGYRGRNSASYGMRFGFLGGALDLVKGKWLYRPFLPYFPERATRSQQWHANKEEEDGKPVMKLFDPCKVPTGKSYFTHDDRSAKTSRSNGLERKFSAPLGWRNAPRDHLAKYRTQSRDIRNASSHSSRTADRDESRPKSGSKPFDEVWKHDLFQEEQDKGEDEE